MSPLQVAECQESSRRGQFESYLAGGGDKVTLSPAGPRPWRPGAAGVWCLSWEDADGAESAATEG